MEDILSSYEQRIEGVQSIFDTTRLVLADFQEGADQAREEQELIHRQLRDVLARNEHLRNKDYDLMIQRIVEPRREQEKEIRTLLNEFLAEQQRLAASLKDCYGQIRDQLAQGNTRKILDLLKSIKELLAEQAQCKEELTSNLREAQADQQATVMLVKKLLVKGNTLRIKDFKDMLAHIQNQGKERIARKFKRREEVRRMLAEFKQQRNKDPSLPTLAPPKAPGSAARLSSPKRERYAGTSIADRQPARPLCHVSPDQDRRQVATCPAAGRRGADMRMQEAFEAIRWSQHPPSFARKPFGLPQGETAFMASEGSAQASPEAPPRRAKIPRALPRGASQGGEQTKSTMQEQAPRHPERVSA